MTPERIITPFVSISREHQQKGWEEKTVTNSDNKKTKVISIAPSSDLSLSPVSEIRASTGLSLRLITDEEIEHGSFTLPPDTINLTRINLDVLNTKGKLGKSVISQVSKFYKAIRILQPEISQDQICFSKEEKQIIILPFIK